MPTKKTTTEKSAKPRKLVGIVTSTKMKDTIVVRVDRYVKHPKYDKYFTKSKKFKAHDAGNLMKVGDKVTIVECPPISKDKHYRLLAEGRRTNAEARGSNSA